MVFREERKARFLQALRGEVDLDQMLAWEYEYLDERKNGTEESKDSLPEIDDFLASPSSYETRERMRAKMRHANEVASSLDDALVRKDWKRCCELMNIAYSDRIVRLMQNVRERHGYTD